MEEAEEFLRGVEERCIAATTGPWKFAESHGQDCIWMDVVAGENEDEIMSGETQPQPHIVHISCREATKREFEQVKADLEFVAHAREDIPRLISMVRELSVLKQRGEK